ncbi:TIGR03862 family flavoprotein [Herminiimonas sp. CN]|uniref:TIGR03862 family flavoprotein n=1 Tax=Herminiimonas sp. CN TaxID=1349818 RepID=UPI00047441DF|nr:TIGR03862 family flavoprotein [Herminiimonas sp. CN]
MISSDTGVRRVVIVGGGPAGLMAAEILAQGGKNDQIQVDLYDAMPSVGRKFLLAGKGGMNITHAEPFEAFLTRYGARRAQLAPLLEAFGPEALRQWAAGLGVATFVGSSGRVFPADMKAAPLLRAWLQRLRAAGVRFHMRQRWRGWDDDGALRFAAADGAALVRPDAVVLALGGGSWARLGSDGAWLPLLAARGVEVAPLQPSNCGFECAWSAHFSSRYAGSPLSTVALSLAGGDAQMPPRKGQFVITEHGVEGSLIYAFSAAIRDAIAARGSATVLLDLAPDWTLERVSAELHRPRGARSIASHLQSRLNIGGVKSGLLRELVSKEDFAQPAVLAARIKALPLTLSAARPLDEAISSAGGVRFEALGPDLMLKALPGVFCAGEMLDWEAPTGGYLLSACFASGRAAGRGALEWLQRSGA